MLQAERVRVQFPMRIKSLQQHYDSGIDSTCHRNEYQKFILGAKGRPTFKTDNLTAICELII
jgi:hypothetical protein